nr:AUGMIN subunit 4 [Ipomoea batatas]
MDLLPYPCSLLSALSFRLLISGLDCAFTDVNENILGLGAQRWRLPLISIDGEIQDDEIEKLSVLSTSSLDNTTPDAFLLSKTTYYDLQLAREEMRKERPHYLKAWVYEVLELWLVAAEAAQRLRLPLISRDDEIEEWSVLSRSSLDSTNSSDPSIGGVPNQYLGITPNYLWETQLRQLLLSMDMAEYQILLSHEIKNHLDAKCEKLAYVVAMDDIGFGAVIKLVKDIKLQHQNKYGLKKLETMKGQTTLLEQSVTFGASSSKMVKGFSKGAQNLPVDVTQLMDQLLSPDGSLLSKSTYYDLQLVLSPSIQLPHYPSLYP